VASWGKAHLYAYLKQLAESGLATVKTEVQANRPPRHVYHLTPAGRETFLAWLHQPVSNTRATSLEFLTAPLFFPATVVPGLEQLVASKKRCCKRASSR